MIKVLLFIMSFIFGYFLLSSIESSKKYRQLIHILGSLGIAMYIIYLLSEINTPNFVQNILDSTTILLLYLTWVGALWVARETFDQKNIANKQILETRKQLDYEVRPYIRLQFKPRRRDDIIKITNEGRGSAIDVIFDAVDIKQGGELNPIQMLSRPIMTPGGKSPVSVIELAKGTKSTDKTRASDDLGLWLETCVEKGLITVTCRYKDVVNDNYIAVFKGDSSYNDGFKIVKQEKL